MPEIIPREIKIYNIPEKILREIIVNKSPGENPKGN